MTKFWLDKYIATLNLIDTAGSGSKVLQLLREALAWLFEGQAQVYVWDEVPSGFSPLVREAMLSLRPQMSEDGTRMAIPLYADHALEGMIYAELPPNADPSRAALAVSLGHTANATLGRLAWPAPPPVFRQLVENANVAIDVVDADGVITYANLATAQLYGFETPVEIVGRRVSEMYYAEEEMRVSRDILSHSRTQEGWTGDVLHQDRYGVPMPVRLAVFGIRNELNQLVAFGGILQSLGEQQRLLISLNQQTQRLRAAAQVAQAAVSKLDVESLLAQAATVMQRLFNYDLVNILLVEGDSLIIKTSQSAQGTLVPIQRRIRLDEYSLNGWVVLHARPTMVNNVGLDARYLQLEGMPHVTSELVVPLRIGERIIGTLDIQSDTRDAFQHEDVETVQGIADQIATAIDNAQLFTAERFQVKQLAALNTISQMLVDVFNLDDVWNSLYEQIAGLFHVLTFFIMTYDPATDRTHFVYIVDNGTVIRPLPPDSPLTGISTLVVRRGAPIHIHDVPAQADWLAGQGAALSLFPGTLMPGSWLGVPLRSRAGAVTGVISVQSEAPNAFTDRDLQLLVTIATQVSLAMDNADLYSQALAANELKSQFLATMSHELRTPLNAILGYTEMLLNNVYGPLGEKQSDRLRRVFVNAQHLLELINDVLDLARIESGRMTLHMEPVNVPALTERIVTHITPQVDAKRLAFVTECAEALPPLIADPIRLRQILINLLSNAVKFTREGRVALRIQTIEATGGLTADGMALPQEVIDGRYVLFSVEDTGIGIAPEHQDMIFHAFRQVDATPVREFQGTGLGLAITRQLVELHGGRLWVQSAIGEGSAFNFVLPVREETA